MPRQVPLQTIAKLLSSTQCSLSRFALHEVFVSIDVTEVRLHLAPNTPDLLSEKINLLRHNIPLLPVLNVYLSHPSCFQAIRHDETSNA